MGTLYVDHAGTELRLRDGVIDLRRDGQSVQRLPAALIKRVVLRAETLMSSNTLAALADAGVGVLAFGGRTGQRTALLVGAPHADTAIRIGQIRRLDDIAFAATWCRTIVRGKLRAQRQLLRRALIERPDQRLALTRGMETLDRLLKGIGDAAGPESARGMEGAGAAAYFHAYASLFAPALAFEGRRRRPPPDPVNACLSLGYTLLYAEAVRACWSAGMDPAIGFLHLPARGRASMACDLMELWRPRIDAWVWTQFRTRELRPEHFGQDGAGACVIGKAARAHLYRAITPMQTTWERGLRLQARLAAHHLARGVALPDEVESASETP